MGAPTATAPAPAAPKVLKSSPSMSQMMVKAALGMTPLAGKRGKEIPPVELQLQGVKTDPHHLAAYCQVCEFPQRNHLPVTYPHMQAFPFPAIGLVHVENRIVQHRPIGVAEAFDLAVRCTPIEPHPKGKQFTFVSEARVGGELVWEDFSTYLRRGGGGDDAAKNGSGEAAGDSGIGPAGKEGADDESSLPVVAVWRLPGGLGRHYGGVSGDRNPIHMHDLTAKLLGFPRAIAHGMWTKARALAQLDSQSLLPESYEVSVRFQRPILLPAKVEFLLDAGDDGTVEFAVRDARKGVPHMAGQVTPRG
jgi:acyl dehydratase